MKFEVEIMRHNVTPSQFLAYVRHQVDKKGGRYLRGDLDLAYFRAGNDLNFDTDHSDPSDPCHGIHEKSVSRPYEMQTYIRYTESGVVYNEICEFEFWDDKTGTGYYYLLNDEGNEGEAWANDSRSPVEKEMDTEAEEALTEEAEKELAAETVKTIREAVEASPARSAWGRGVKVYAAELLDNLAEAVAGGWVTLSDVTSPKLLERALLNGADDWRMFSEGGCSLIYNADIAERLCNPTELKRTDGGRRDPNSRENWIDVQSRALYQAARLIAEKAAEVIAK